MSLLKVVNRFVRDLDRREGAGRKKETDEVGSEVEEVGGEWEKGKVLSDERMSEKSLLKLNGVG